MLLFHALCQVFIVGIMSSLTKLFRYAVPQMLEGATLARALRFSDLVCDASQDRHTLHLPP